MKAVELMAVKGITPPVYVSGNIEGGQEHNKKFIEQYKYKLKHL